MIQGGKGETDSEREPVTHSQEGKQAMPMRTCATCGNHIECRRGPAGKRLCWDCWHAGYIAKRREEQKRQRASREPEMCRACHEHKANRPRGLCWHCYYTPRVARKYPSTSKHAPGTGVGNGCGGYALPEPTEAAPGSAEKVAVLADRAAAGLALWHPQDANHERETPAFLSLQGIEAEDTSDE